MMLHPGRRGLKTSLGTLLPKAMSFVQPIAVCYFSFSSFYWPCVFVCLRLFVLDTEFLFPSSSLRLVYEPLPIIEPAQPVRDRLSCKVGPEPDRLLLNFLQ